MMAASDHAIGVESNYNWYNAITTGGHKWYMSGVNYMTLTSASLALTVPVSATNVYVTSTAAGQGVVSATYGYFRYISGTSINGSFSGDGSGLTNITAGSSDRIVSGTNNATSMIAISNTGFISITQGAAATNTGWFDPQTGYVGLGVSTTGRISGTSGYYSGNVGIGTATALASLTVGAVGSNTSLSTVFAIRDGSGDIGSVAGDYKYPAEIQYKATNNTRLQFARTCFGTMPITALALALQRRPSRWRWLAISNTRVLSRTSPTAEKNKTSTRSRRPRSIASTGSNPSPSA